MARKMPRITHGYLTRFPYLRRYASLEVGISAMETSASFKSSLMPTEYSHDADKRAVALVRAGEVEVLQS